MGRPWMLAAGIALFRLASAAFPRRFARKHAEEMVAAFETELERVRRGNGTLATGWYAARASWDTFGQGVRERIRRSPPRGHGAPPPPRGRRLGSGLGTDIRVAFRGLSRAPGFTVAAVGVLALGIGANTTVFSALRVVILSPPPYPRPDRLVFVDLTQDHVGRGDRRLTSWSYPKFEGLRKAEGRLIDPVAGFSSRTATLTGLGPATRIPYELVSPPYFRLLGASPVLGRTFTPDEDDASDPPLVAVLSHQLWRSRFAGDAGALERDITLDGARLRIVGVAPEGFRGLSGDAELWVPLAAADDVLSYSASTQAGNHWFFVLGRLADEATLPEALARMEAIGTGIAEAYPSRDPQSVWSASVRPFGDVHVNEGARSAVVLLTVAALVVLLAACANLSGLLLARAKQRARDGAVRRAVGASRWRIVRASLGESLLLSTLGGGAGVALALWGTKAMAAAWPGQFLSSERGEMRVTDLSHLGLEPAVLVFAVAATLATAVLFGMGPALRVSGADVSTAIKDGTGATRRAKGPMGGDGRTVLVGSQIALALVLLIGAGLVASSTARLLDVDEGVVTENLVTFRYAIPETSAWSDRQQEFHDELLARLASLPPVVSATSGTPPLRGYWAQTRVDAVDGGPPIPPGEGVLIGVQMVEDGYFDALGIPLLRGRLFDENDGTDRFPAIVISERTALELFPGVDPVGSRIRIGISDDEKDPWSEIVGVVGNVLYRPPDQPAMPGAYYVDREFGVRSADVLVRTTTDPLAIMPSIREQTAALDPTLAIYGISTMDRIVAASVGDHRVILVLLGLFAAVTVLLAATGTWGIVSFSVADRRRELGLRMALGAAGSRIMRLVLRQSGAAALAGVALGVLSGAAGSRLLEAFLWETGPRDLLVYAGGAAFLLAVVLLASWAPARAVLRVDPAEALRSE